MREWTRRGLAPAAEPRAPVAPRTIPTILRNPALAGLVSYRGEIMAKGNWRKTDPPPVEQWEAVRGRCWPIRRDGAARCGTLLGGLAICPCGNTVQGPELDGEAPTGAGR